MSDLKTHLIAFIVIVVLLALTPIFVTFVGNVTGLGSYTGAQEMLNLLPLFWIITLLGLLVATVWSAFRKVRG